MKAIQKFSKIVFVVLLLIISSSCSDDDSPNNDNPDPQGESHFYELSFTGGPTDGDTFSGTLPNGVGTSGVVAVRSISSNNQGVTEDIAVLTLIDEIHSPNLSMGMVLTMNGNQGMDFGPNVNETSSGMSITYNNYIMSTISGTSTITNYGQDNVYGGITYAHFKITFSAEMQVYYANEANTFTTQVTGTINVKRPVK